MVITAKERREGKRNGIKRDVMNSKGRKDRLGGTRRKTVTLEEAEKRKRKKKKSRKKDWSDPWRDG